MAKSNVPQLVNKKGGSYYAITLQIEVGKFNKWKKRILCYLTRIEPYYITCIKDGPFQPKAVEGANKPEAQWLNDERRVFNQDQHLKSIIISCLRDYIMESTLAVRHLNKHGLTWFTALKAVNESIGLTMAPTGPESSKESDSELQTSLPLLKILQGALSSLEDMPLTYLEHSPRERPGLETVKHTNLNTQDYSSKCVLGLVIVKNSKPVTTLVPTEFKNDEQESKINELAKLVQMLIDEKVNSS
nr:retrovirus-related Pol polyprotein from transposon TNT 1-94 [Tanacetum cinerariifolium]